MCLEENSMSEGWRLLSAASRLFCRRPEPWRGQERWLAVASSVSIYARPHVDHIFRTYFFSVFRYVCFQRHSTREKRSHLLMRGMFYTRQLLWRRQIRWSQHLGSVTTSRAPGRSQLSYLKVKTEGWTNVCSRNRFMARSITVREQSARSYSASRSHLWRAHKGLQHISVKIRQDEICLIR